MSGTNIIACIWDFDKTIIPGFMQETLFKAFNLDCQKSTLHRVVKRYMLEGLR